MKFMRRPQSSPIDDQLAEADIQDRLQLANALRQKSMQGAELENVGGHLIGSPVARVLTSAVQGIQGEGERKRAYNMAGDLATSKRERLAQALSGAGQEPTPEARLKRGMELMGHPDPQAQAVGQYMAESAQKEIDQRQKALDTQRGETNKDLRHMQDLYQRDQAATRQAGATKEAAQIRADAIKARGPAAEHMPAATIQEINYLRSLDALPPDQREAKRNEFFAVKRAQQVLDRGGSQDVLQPGAAPGTVAATLPKTLAPNQTPEHAREVAHATEVGKEAGIADASLADLEASMPHLEQVVKDLHTLGQKATYTLAGQGVNTVKRQLGMKVGDPAAARVEYMKKIDNEVLPLLRQTFGAQFTLVEGQELRTTLGDPDKSPEEKDAALKAFIEARRAQILTKQRRVATPPAAPGGGAPVAPPAAPADDEDALIGKYLNGQP